MLVTCAECPKYRLCLANFSVHGKSKSFTRPKSSPVTIFRPAWVTHAQLTSALSAFRGQIPMTSSPRMLFQNQVKKRALDQKTDLLLFSSKAWWGNAPGNKKLPSLKTSLFPLNHCTECDLIIESITGTYLFLLWNHLHHFIQAVCAAMVSSFPYGHVCTSHSDFWQQCSLLLALSSWMRGCLFGCRVFLKIAVLPLV